MVNETPRSGPAPSACPEDLASRRYLAEQWSHVPDQVTARARNCHSLDRISCGDWSAASLEPASLSG